MNRPFVSYPPEGGILVQEAPQRQRSKDSSQTTRVADEQDGSGEGSKYAAYRTRILDVFRTAPTHAYTTREIFAEADIKEGKLGNSILSRLAKSGEIERLSRGNYRLRRRGSLSRSDPPISYHGVHMVLSEGAPSPRLAAALTALDSTLTAHDGKREIVVPLGPSREAAILSSPSGTIEVRIACADNPMSAEVLYGVLRALDGLLDLGFTTHPWEAARIESNRDHVGFAIDGASAVTVNLGDFLLKAYDRPGILREEVVLHHVPLLEVFEHLNGQGAIGNERLAEALETMAKEFALMRRSYDAFLIEMAEQRKQREANAKTAK